MKPALPSPKGVAAIRTQSVIHSLSQGGVITAAEQRASYIEGRLDALAPKTDLAQLEVRLVKEISVHLRWMVGLQLVGLGAVAAIMRFLG